jgi:hypothetical protein
MAAIKSIYDVPRLYHFTDVRNLPLIRELGGLYPWAELNKMGQTVPVPGGNEWSHDADAQRGLDGYVHLCFRENHPMEYQARQEGRLGTSIFLEIDPIILKDSGVLYTPDVSNKAGVESHPIANADQMLDFEVLYDWTDWKDPKVKERLRQAQKCEVLVPRLIPLLRIRNMPNG